jgi:hypothetical protein
MIQAYQTKQGIGFRIHANVLQEITHWSNLVDEMVFKEQLVTGRFRGHEIDPDMLAIMKQAHATGKILPYYGVGGSRGVCDYRIKVFDVECTLTVEHGETGQSLVVTKPKDISRFAFQPKQVRRFKFSPMPYLYKQKLPAEWSGKLPDELLLVIVGKEYHKLSSWPNWSYDEALTERYEYSFGEVSMGRIGFVVKVTDLENEVIVDVIDYEDW